MTQTVTEPCVYCGATTQYHWASCPNFTMAEPKRTWWQTIKETVTILWLHWRNR